MQSAVAHDRASGPAPMVTESQPVRRPSRSFASVSVALFERWMPDALILAIGLTAVVALCALLFAPRGTLPIVLTSWYSGMFGILNFAFQMILVLVTGHALAHSPLIQHGLKVLVSTVTTA